MSAAAAVSSSDAPDLVPSLLIIIDISFQVDHNSNSNLFQMVAIFREEKEKNEKMSQQNTQLRSQV